MSSIIMHQSGLPGFSGDVHIGKKCDKKFYQCELENLFSSHFNEQDQKIYASALEAFNDLRMWCSENEAVSLDDYEAYTISLQNFTTPEMLREMFYRITLLKLRECDDLSKDLHASVPASSNSCTFGDLTRLLPPDSPIFAMAANKEFLTEAKSLSQQLAVGAWDELLNAYKGKTEALAEHALVAVYNGYLTGDQFVTLMFRWSMIEDFQDVPIETHHLFNDDGTINEETRYFIDQTLLTGGDKNYEGLFLASSDARASFYDYMRQQPPSEQVIFSMSRSLVKEGNDILETVFTSTRVNVFTHFMNGSEKRRMFPSAGMIRAFLQADQKTHGGDAVTPRFVIGRSPFESIMDNGRKGERDVAVPALRVPLPKKAHFVDVLHAIDFVYHDIYHCIGASFMPDAARRAFIRLAEGLQQLVSEDHDPIVAEYLDKWIKCVADMENPPYRNLYSNRTASKGKRFMLSLFDQGEMAKVELMAQMQARESALEANFEWDDKYWERRGLLRIKLAASGLVRKFAELIVRNGICEEFGITTTILRRLADEQLNLATETNASPVDCQDLESAKLILETDDDSSVDGEEADDSPCADPENLEYELTSKANNLMIQLLDLIERDAGEVA